MSGLIEFLLARIAEDEASADEVHWWECGRFNVDIADARGDCDCGGPYRVLAECEAKRRIVERHADLMRQSWADESAQRRYAIRGEVAGLWFAMTAQASVYSDHPDFNPDWRFD